MRKLTIFGIFITFFIFLAIRSHAESIYGDENLNVHYISNKDGKLHAQAAIEIKERDGIYTLDKKAQGHYDKYRDVLFSMSSQFEINNGQMQVNRSLTKIFDLKGQQIAEFEKTYDYNLKKVTYIKRNPRNEIELEKIFPIKGPVCDDATLVHFLRSYMPRLGEDNFKRFYLLSNEPKLYDVVIFDKGEEVLELSAGSKPARKLQLVADVGPLTEIAKHVVAPTYVWYETEIPHIWLQYEGMDAGYGSTNIVASAVERNLP